MRRGPRLIGFLIAVTAGTGCASDAKKVRDATEAARSWAATVQVVTEQWAQSRVSQRFTRTTLTTAIRELNQQAESIRAADPVSAARIDRLKDAIAPALTAIARNQPDRARDAAATLTFRAKPEPITASETPR